MYKFRYSEYVYNKYKKNAFPNLSGRRLTASHETMLWAHSGGKKREYYFDYEYSKNGEFPGDELKSPGKQMRTVWDLSNNKAQSQNKTDFIQKLEV